MALCSCVRRFKKANKSGMDEDMARYLDIEPNVKLWDAERVYVNGSLRNGLPSKQWGKKPLRLVCILLPFRVIGYTQWLRNKHGGK